MKQKSKNKQKKKTFTNKEKILFLLLVFVIVSLTIIIIRNHNIRKKYFDFSKCNKRKTLLVYKKELYDWFESQSSDSYSFIKEGKNPVSYPTCTATIFLNSEYGFSFYIKAKDGYYKEHTGDTTCGSLTDTAIHHRKNAIFSTDYFQKIYNHSNIREIITKYKDYLKREIPDKDYYELYEWIGEDESLLHSFLHELHELLDQYKIKNNLLVGVHYHNDYLNVYEY